MRNWVGQAEIDEGYRPGVTTDEAKRISELEREVKELRRDNDKKGLFATVLNDELAKVAQAVPLDSLREGRLGAFAGEVFDYHAAHPHLLRLLHWEALAYGRKRVPNESARRTFYREKVEALRAAQADGLVAANLEPVETVFLLIAMAVWWFSAPQVDRMLSGGRARDARARQRAAVVAAADCLGGAAQRAT